ncbi:PREDICTED: uncharacterized protein LOC105110910 [Populus euphratica]|uniref:Transmembrane 9 superfamily member n=1 Tax=Populus euphratica TaxID=75702 RepID=A0AAJ6T550_POPEU|nr:PREDICTED: uncharacterized protein LOC105110910 [Populus euphratica]
MIEELCKWKLVVGDDVFREPDCSKLLCVMVGDGVQIIGMPVVTTGFLALGFMSPASRGIDAADRDDFTVSFPRYCGRLCCSTFPESHRRSSRGRREATALVQFLLLVFQNYSEHTPRVIG